MLMPVLMLMADADNRHGGTGMKMSRYDGARTSQHKPEPVSRPPSILLLSPITTGARHGAAPSCARNSNHGPTPMRRSLIKWPGPALACSTSDFLGMTSSSPRASSARQKPCERTTGLGRGQNLTSSAFPSNTQRELRSSPDPNRVLFHCNRPCSHNSTRV